jgi:hypothetical protein
MKKIFSLIQLAVLSAGSSAFALVGGPFDNGDYSILLERAGTISPRILSETEVAIHSGRQITSKAR